LFSTESIKKFRHETGLADFIKLGGEAYVVSEDENKRSYKTPSDVKYPSVTTVTGWKKKAFFKEWREKNPEESQRVLSVGNDMHKIIEDYLNNKGMNRSGESEGSGLAQQMLPLLKNIDMVRALEIALWSDLLKVAGRVDCIAEYRGKPSIIDFKSSRRLKKEEQIRDYFAQATAYSIMWKERTGEQIDQIVILISCEDGEIQEMIDSPINHVETLKSMIDEYYAESA
jgi:hypothetical protein